MYLVTHSNEVVFRAGSIKEAVKDYQESPQHWEVVGGVNILGNLTHLHAPKEVWKAFREAQPIAAGHQVDETGFPCSPIPEVCTVRFSNGWSSARATYNPSYDCNCPWISYIDGTAGQHFKEIKDAEAYFTGKGFRKEFAPKSRPRP